MIRPPPEKCVGFAGVLLLFAASAGSVLVLGWGNDVIAAAYEGRSFPLVNRYISIHAGLDPDNRTLEYYLANGTPPLVRILSLLALSGILLITFRNRIVPAVERFFSATATAEHLAFFRIVVFGSVLWWLFETPVSSFAGLPSDLIVPPPGLAWATWLLPDSDSAVSPIVAVLACFSAAAMVGYKTRWTTAGAALLSLYVMGIPQFYGKIDHYHHFIWFSTLLAFAPSGDAFSIDSVLSRSSVQRGNTAARVYALPLRFAMILIGLLYFFPGLWKVIVGGTQWAEQTMQYQMYAKWMSLDWLPSFRIDEYPTLLTLVGYGVLVFELTCIFLLMSETWRVVGVAAGMLFHAGVYVFMQINFLPLLVCYVVFLGPTAVGTLVLRRNSSETVNSTDRSGEGYAETRVKVTGTVLVGMVMVAGCTLFDSWPIAVYPTFAGLPEERVYALTLGSNTGSETPDERRPLSDPGFRSAFGPSRAEGLVNQSLWAVDPNIRERKAVAVASVYLRTYSSSGFSDTVTVYRDLVSVHPDRWGDPPVRREVLAIVAAAKGRIE